MNREPVREWRCLLAAAVDAAFVAGDAICDVYERDISVDYKADNSPLTAADRAAHAVISSRLGGGEIPLLSEEGLQIAVEERQGWERMWLIDPLDGTKEFIKRNGEFTVNIALIERRESVLGVVYAPVSRDLYLGIVGVGAYIVRGAVDRAAVRAACASGELGAPLQKVEVKPLQSGEEIRVVASRSHGSAETDTLIEGLSRYSRNVERVSRGSSLKLCMVATGEAHIYPRLAPTMEWDTAAAQAVVNSVGGCVVVCDDTTLNNFTQQGLSALFGAAPLTYNRTNQLNPWFAVLHPSLRDL
ncbi:MAG: 3'(2'),5'-bisphosphate nucleotidase CysQ [Lentisphaerae bacterium]|nr:3'(2'),5'-bisphosphate nucleotidase CysQ [Lentisphaerota bacterium]